MTTKELPATVAALTAAWNPPAPTRVADDEPWEGDDCDCGGTDSHDRPMCSCGDGCSCDRCNHLQHASKRTCGVKDCHAVSQVQVKAWAVSHHVVRASDINPDLTPEDGGDETVQLDDKPSYTWTTTACTYAHAQQIVDHDREWRSGSQSSRPPEDRMRYEIAQYEYEPHDLDLPAVLAELRDVGNFLKHNTRELAKAGCRHTADAVRNPERQLADARRRAAELVTILAALSTVTPAPRRWGPGTHEPEGARSVMRGDTHFHNNRLGRRAGRSEWHGPTISQVYTWDELTAQGEVVEVPTSRLIIGDNEGVSGFQPL